MNIFTRIGSWIEKHFPEKMTTGEIYDQFAGFKSAVENIRQSSVPKIDLINLATMIGDEISSLKKKVESIESELTTIKNQISFKNRVAGTPSTPMTPFASHRLPPVQPANSNGGVSTGAR